MALVKKYKLQVTQKITIKDLSQHIGKTVRLQGWVSNIRSSGKIFFLVLRDGREECQCVFSEANSSPESFLKSSQINLETSVELEGTVKQWKDGFEIQGKNLEIISSSKGLYPLGKKAHGVDFLVSHRHLWLRSKRQRAIMKIRNTVIHSLHTFFQKEGFLHIDAPLLTPNVCEGTSALFEVDFFDQDKMYLSQSGQLYMEAAAAAYGKVYSFGPTFRAEKSSTRRHLLEFWMIEPEMAFCDLQQAMQYAEKMLETVVQETLLKNAKDFQVLERDLTFLEKVQAPFPQLSYKEACKKLKENNPQFQEGQDLGAKDETLISSHFDKPCFVHRYPKKIKAFYMKEDPNQATQSLSFDLLAPEGFGELIGGGQREDSLEKLETEIKAHQLNQNDFEWYLDLRRWGNSPHSGFGLGLERLVSWLCKLDHVREAIPFPRLYGRSFFEQVKTNPSKNPQE